MHRKKHLSPTHEMYLKVLYDVSQEHDVARVRDVSRGLGVSPGTVSSGLKPLEQMGFVKHDRYGTVRLTPRGVNVAECMMRRFETLRGLLVEVLGVPAETAEVDACMMEHAVSPATVNRMEALLFLARAGEIDIPSELAQVARQESECAETCESKGSCQAAASGTMRLVSGGNE